VTDFVKKRLKFGAFEADLGTGELRKSGCKLKLAGQPFQILAALIQRPGEMVTREELRNAIWPADTFTDFNHGLNAAVNKLRAALNDSAEEPRYIETVPRKGYRFIGALNQPSAVPAELPPQPSVPKQLVEPEEIILRQPALEQLTPPVVPVTIRSTSYIWAAAAFVLLAGLYGAADLAEKLLNPPSAAEHARNLLVESTGVPAPGLEVRKREAPPSPEARELAKKSLLAAGLKPPQVNPGSAGIWRVELAHGSGDTTRLVVPGTGRTEGPQPSPDGRRLAFMSDRSGTVEIWVSDADGSNPAQLTHLGACGSPQWSPDGRWIAFDSYGSDGSTVYMVSAIGQPVTVAVDAKSESFVPRWSRDGKWLYFASERTGEMQVWKTAIGGGPAIQVTHDGGFAAYESYDGATLYFAKSKYEYPEIWQMPVGGGRETLASPLLRPSTWANWAITESGILYVNSDTDQTFSINFYDFATRGVRPVGHVGYNSFWLAATRKGRSVWYAQPEVMESAVLRDGR
jgi:DNA-binding winged helix-turn-helix (wHTH) protein